MRIGHDQGVSSSTIRNDHNGLTVGASGSSSWRGRKHLSALHDERALDRNCLDEAAPPKIGHRAADGEHRDAISHGQVTFR